MRFNWSGFLRDTVHALIPRHAPHMRLTGRRVRVLALFYPCMVFMVAAGRLGLALDRLFFPAYRRAEVRAPLFIIGNFRTGSTLLHRLLAGSPGMVALKTWEIYFAPSITQRKFWRGVWIVDASAGGLIRRRILAAEERRLGSVPMHTVRLAAPEEDEALLLYLWESLFNWFFMPHDPESNPYWRFDDALPARRRRRILRFYREVLLRRLSEETGSAVYVAKNPAFTAKIGSLLEVFPDARFIELVRHPYETLVSTAGWLSYAWHYFASPVERFPFLPAVMEMTREWFLRTAASAGSLGHGRYALLRYEEFTERPLTAVSAALRGLGMEPHPILMDALGELERNPRPERSHGLGIADLGLTRQELAVYYRDVLDRFGYEP